MVKIPINFKFSLWVIFAYGGRELIEAVPACSENKTVESNEVTNRKKVNNAY